MKLCAFLLLCVVAPLNSVWATDYCDPKLCRGGARHIGCRASNKFGPQCPADVDVVHFSKERQNFVVTEINKLRNLIAGGGHPKHLPACRMATISWDNELAVLAELNAKQCVMQHDQCHNTDAFKFSGQNLAWMEYSAPLDTEREFGKGIKMWYDEVVYSDMRNIKKYPKNGFAFGHFTVMMADKNIRVGCGATTFTRKGSKYPSLVLACNFATNNIINRAIYKDCPRPAMECTSGTNPQYPNLCSSAEVIDVNKL